MSKNNKTMEEKFDTLIELMQHLLALELYKSGATMDVICKRLHIGKVKIVEMLKGVQRER